MRYDESIGLIRVARDPNGYRRSDEDLLEQVGFINSAKHLGLTLTEIVELVGVVEVETCTRVREDLRRRLERRLADVDRRLADLQGLRTRLAEAAQRVAGCPDSGAPCRGECLSLGAQVTARVCR